MQLDVYVRARMRKTSCLGNGACVRACAVSPTQCGGTAAILCGMQSVDWLINGAVRRIPRKPCPIMATSRWSCTSLFSPRGSGRRIFMNETHTKAYGGGGNCRHAALPSHGWAYTQPSTVWRSETWYVKEARRHQQECEGSSSRSRSSSSWLLTSTPQW